MKIEKEILHVDCEQAILDIEKFIEEHFWQSKKQFYETNRRKTPPEYTMKKITVIVE
ncbi:MAG: hypothetical protein KAT68_19605 [Bacteroidales bacterium]|nr:hypothetical protein [Bacteroidales bacterium]